MALVVISLAALGVAATLFVFAHTTPAGPSFWYGHPWMDLAEAWPLVLTFAVLFVLYAILVGRRAPQALWFFALGFSCLPAVSALRPVAYCLDVAKHSGEWLDAGADVPFQISVAERVYVLSLAFSLILAGMATYGYFARRKT